MQPLLILTSKGDLVMSPTYKNLLIEPSVEVLITEDIGAGKVRTEFEVRGLLCSL